MKHFSTFFFLLFMSGGKNSSSGDKEAEWWLGPTTPDQCGQNPAIVQFNDGLPLPCNHDISAIFGHLECAPSWG